MEKHNAFRVTRPFRGLSIQQRLPLLICILLLTIITIGGLISYLEVKSATQKAATQRLLSSGEQLVGLLNQSTQGVIISTRNQAREPELVNFLINQDSISKTAALNKLKQAQDSSTLFVEVLDKGGKTLLLSGKDGNEGIATTLAEIQLPDTGKVGNIRQINKTLYYPVSVAIMNNQAIAGYLVKWRKIANSPRTMALLANLMGMDQSSLYFGNADNSLWTHEGALVKNPLVTERAEENNGVYVYKNDAGKKYFATSKPIRLTSWQVMIEIPEQTVMAPARDFLKKVIIIGLLLLAIGMFWAWLISRRITTPLNKLTEAASSIAGGKYASSVELDRRDEVGKLARAFNAMMVQVRSAKQKLEMQVVETEQMNDQLRELSAHLQNIREEERMHIAREMHDELGQFLTGLKMDISWLNKRLYSSTQESTDPNAAANKEKLKEMSVVVDEAVVFVRRLAAELRPSILDDLGLIPALEWHSREFTRRFNIDVKLVAEQPDITTSSLIATGLFRMYQESLTNVARHAQAKNVDANVKVVNGQIQLSITDNGKGFDTTGQRKTLGLLGMKERAMMIGGKLEITSQPGIGTTILITVPLVREITPIPVH